ncbi:retrovirus-related Pol polyprotein from transposon 297 [Trichonephila clavipes]|nr:retrovirus-related Pol polyprotein from transposon 297 [Trichonephila clavipes]
MDDVIISSPLFTHHVEHLREAFRLLQEAGLTLDKEKCKFGCDELKYLCLIIGKERIKTDETKFRAIVKMKPPRNSKEISKFLSMSQWYVKLIKNYADLCDPLYNLKRKLKNFCWSIEAQKAFDAVKAEITKVPVLKLSDFKKPFELFKDASSMSIGAVLNQEQRPVVLSSRTLRSEERNDNVTERGCFAVVWALNKFRTYLGSMPFKVITDHAALTRLTKEEQKWSPDLPLRRGHKKDYQFEPEEAENISTAPTSKSKQGQQVGRPEAELINNSIPRRGKEERTADDPNHSRF